MVFEPLTGERQVSVTDHRTKLDWAKCIKDIVDIHYPEAAKITVISLYQAFSPEEARRLLNKLEFHYTPKHGSWLNMAEIEFRDCTKTQLPKQVLN